MVYDNILIFFIYYYMQLINIKLIFFIYYYIMLINIKLIFFIYYYIKLINIKLIIGNILISIIFFKYYFNNFNYFFFINVIYKLSYFII
jgi:hypothetical protein